MGVEMLKPSWSVAAPEMSTWYWVCGVQCGFGARERIWAVASHLKTISTLGSMAKAASTELSFMGFVNWTRKGASRARLPSARSASACGGRGANVGAPVPATGSAGRPASNPATRTPTDPAIRNSLTEPDLRTAVDKNIEARMGRARATATIFRKQLLLAAGSVSRWMTCREGNTGPERTANRQRRLRRGRRPSAAPSERDSQPIVDAPTSQLIPAVSAWSAAGLTTRREPPSARSDHQRWPPDPAIPTG